jgi:hypothetical protein
MYSLRFPELSASMSQYFIIAKFMIVLNFQLKERQTILHKASIDLNYNVCDPATFMSQRQND